MKIEWGKRVDWEAIGYWGVVVFSIVGSYGLWKQGRKIWQEKSSESVSVTANFFFLASMVAGWAYGIDKNLDAVVFHNILRIIFLFPIVWGLAKFKTFTKAEKYLIVFLTVVVVLTWLSPQKELYFLFFQTAGVISAAAQPYEIFKNKSAGAVEIRLYIVFAPSSLFWIIYAFETGDLILEITQPIFLAIMILTIVLCMKYKKLELTHAGHKNHNDQARPSGLSQFLR